MTVNRFVGSTTSSERRHDISKNDFRDSSIKTVSSMHKNTLNDSNHTKLGLNSSTKRDISTEDCGMDEIKNQVIDSR